VTRPEKGNKWKRGAKAGFTGATLLGVSGSSGFGWFGIFLLRLNFPEFVAIRSGFKALRRLFGILHYRSQGQYPVLNLEEGSDNFADAISL